MKKSPFNKRWLHSGSWKLAVILVVLILFSLVPYAVGRYVLYLIIVFCLWAVAALSLNWILGYGGQFSLCHASFQGIGAYTSALLCMSGMSFWLSLPIAAVLTMVLSYLIAVPSLQWFTNPYFAIVTLGFATIIRLVFANWTDVTWGINGLYGIPRPSPIPLPFGSAITFTSDKSFFYLVYAFFLITVLFSYWFAKSRAGLALKAIRDDEEASECLGVDNRKFKILAFVLGAAFVSIVGALFASFIQVISPDDFAYGSSFDFAVMVLFGGRGTLLGPILGAAFVTFLLEYLRIYGYLRLVVYGAIFVSVLLYSPSGIMGILPKLRDFGRMIRERVIRERLAKKAK